jgi:hypothetical protein
MVGVYAMSLYKRIWIDRDPAYADVRKKITGDSDEIIPQYPHGAPLRRRNRLAPSPHWDPLWPRRLAIAAEDLKLETIIVNSRMMFRTAEARDAAMKRGEQLWAEEIVRRGGPYKKPDPMSF